MKVDRDRLWNTLSEYEDRTKTDIVDALLADIEAQGFVIVPREATIPMLIAGRKQTFADMTGAHLGPNCERTWSAMIAASEEPTE